MMLWALNLTIDAGLATVLTALFLMITNLYQLYQGRKIHTLVNSNFTEAKAARIAAEAALKTSQDLNVHLQQQLDARPAAVPRAPAGVGPGTGSP